MLDHLNAECRMRSAECLWHIILHSSLSILHLNCHLNEECGMRNGNEPPIGILHSALRNRVAPVAQLPERDASNVGDEGESPSGSASFCSHIGLRHSAMPTRNISAPAYAGDR